VTKPLAIEIPNVIEPTAKSVYIINGQDTFLKHFLIFYSSVGPGEEVLTIGKSELSFEQVIEILKKNNIPYQEIFKLDTSFLEEVRRARRTYTTNLHALTTALLFTIESEEKPSFVPLWGTLDCLPLYDTKNPQIVSPKFLKSILLSTSRINFYHLQLLSVPYDIIWNDISQGQDFADLFTKEEATQIYKKVFVPEFSKDEVIISPGWMRLFCMIEKADTVYEKLLSQVKKVEVNPFLLCKIRKDTNTYGCEKIISRLLREKKPEVSIVNRYPQPVHSVRSTVQQPLENNSLSKTIALLILIQHVRECEEWFHTNDKKFWYFSEIERFNIEQETFDFLIAELKTLIKNYFSSSPFMVSLFYIIPYMLFGSFSLHDEKFGKSFFYHFKDFLFSLPNALLKEQVFRKISRFNKPILIMLASARLNISLIDDLTEKCINIKNFPLEVFLFYPEIRKCKNYDKLVLRVAKSEKRIIGYVEMFRMIESEKDLSDLPSLLEKYKTIYLDVRKNIPINIVRRVLQRKYVVDGIEDKIKVLAVSSEKDRIGFKRYSILKEVGLRKGDIHDVVYTILKTHAVSSFYDLVKLIGEAARKMNDKEFDFFVQLISQFVRVSGSYVYTAQGDSDLFLERVNVDHAISALRKIKEAAKEESQ